MLNINSIKKPVSRYLYKNTINAKYNRNIDFATATSLGFAVQIARMPYWEDYDIPTTAFCGALWVNSVKNILKNRIALSPIIKRAKSIKNTAKP